MAAMLADDASEAGRRHAPLILRRDGLLNLPLLAVGALLFLSVVLGVFSSRVGFPFLLVFLLAGALAGENGPGGCLFSDFGLNVWVGNIALAVILLDGGMRSEAFAAAGDRRRAGQRGGHRRSSRGPAGPGWKSGLLLGAIIGSSDAAAVFALLNRPGVVLSERVGATLEIESGMNDPMAVYLTLTVIGLIVTAGPGTLSGWNVAMTLLRQFGRGALLGVRCGMLMAALVLRLPLEEAGGGILALMLGSAGSASSPRPACSADQASWHRFGFSPTRSGSSPGRPARPAVVRDRLAVGPATFFVRAMEGAQITGVGLKLEDQALATDR